MLCDMHTIARYPPPSNPAPHLPSSCPKFWQYLCVPLPSLLSWWMPWYLLSILWKTSVPGVYIGGDPWIGVTCNPGEGRQPIRGSLSKTVVPWTTTVRSLWDYRSKYTCTIWSSHCRNEVQGSRCCSATLHSHHWFKSWFFGSSGQCEWSQNSLLSPEKAVRQNKADLAKGSCWCTLPYTRVEWSRHTKYLLY